MQKASKIWLNGELVPWKKANIHIVNPSLNYGQAAIEGIRCHRTEKGIAIFRLKDHVNRLFQSWGAFRNGTIYSKKHVAEAIIKTVRANKFTDCYIRPIYFLTAEELRVDPTRSSANLAIIAFPMGAYLGRKAGQGAKLKVSKFIRAKLLKNITGKKLSGNYLLSGLAKQEAIYSGFDEALLIDEYKNVCEGSSENIFIVKKGAIITPKDNVLAGVTRESIIEIARDMKIKVKIRNFKMRELYSADEVFLAGTASDIIPVKQVNIKKFRIGPLSLKLHKALTSAQRGRTRKYEKWLTYIK